MQDLMRCLFEPFVDLDLEGKQQEVGTYYKVAYLFNLETTYETTYIHF